MDYRISFYHGDDLIDESPLSQDCTVVDLMNKKVQLAFDRNCRADDIEVRIGIRPLRIETGGDHASASIVGNR